jgi:hypothetical protein
MKKIFLLLIVLNTTFGYSQANHSIDETLELWHKAAAEANFENYTALMAEDCVFIGTDATENWKGEAFLNFAKPYFDKGKAWTFHTITRNIYNEEANTIAWFDELLKTQMGICRGSGTISYINGHWKIKHYVLSIAIPNENVDQVKVMNDSFNKSFVESVKK